MTDQSKPSSIDAREWAFKMLERMHSLCDQHNIPRPDDSESTSGWFKLAMVLTIEREPSLNPFPKKTGAKLAPNVGVQDMLILHALGANRPKSKSISAAAMHLSKHPRFIGKTPGYIRKRFYILMDEKTPESQRIRKLVRSLQTDSSEDTCT